MTQPATYTLAPIGFVRSTLTRPQDAPMQGSEGGPDAWLEIEPALVDALKGVAPGDAIVVLTWLHEANRDTLQVHPRDDQTRPWRAYSPHGRKTGPTRSVCTGCMSLR
jgi:tRNA (Thr-GGU) A37 N-methylase